MNVAAMLVALVPLAAQAPAAPEPSGAEPAAAPATPPDAAPAVQTGAPAPPAAAPRDPTPSFPPGPYVPAERERSPWYLAFGVGTGNGSAAGPGGTASFSEMNSGHETDLLLEVQAGWTVSPTWLVGFDLTALASAADANGATSSVTVANADVVATVFPYGRGFFLRGGAGRSVIAYTVKDPIAGSSRWDASGFNVLAGVGYAFWIGRRFNLTVDLDVSQQWYLSGDLDGSRFWAGYVGFGWY